MLGNALRLLIKSLFFSLLHSAGFKFRYVLFFALMTPVGIAVGTIITEFMNDPSTTESSPLVQILQTIAAGTLLYVAFFEVSQLPFNLLQAV